MWVLCLHVYFFCVRGVCVCEMVVGGCIHVCVWVGGWVGVMCVCVGGWVGVM